MFKIGKKKHLYYAGKKVKLKILAFSANHFLAAAFSSLSLYLINQNLAERISV